MNGSLENAYDTFVIVSPYTNYPRSEQKAFPCTIETIDNLICNLYFHLSCFLCIQVDCYKIFSNNLFYLQLKFHPEENLKEICDIKFVAYNMSKELSKFLKHSMGSRWNKCCCDKRNKSSKEHKRKTMSVYFSQPITICEFAFNFNENVVGSINIHFSDIFMK